MVDLSRLLPECRFNPEFVDRLHQHAEVVAKNLTKHFVYHGCCALGTDATSELRLNHVERRFDVAPPMIVPKEVVLPVQVVVEHLIPRRRLPAACIERAFECGVHLQSDERFRSMRLNRLRVRC